jgi:hypothetical protein
MDLALQKGYPSDGPFPGDVAIVRALKRVDGYDGVVTMYHDQVRGSGTAVRGDSSRSTGMAVWGWTRHSTTCSLPAP